MQISDEIIKVLDYLCSKIGFTIDWTNNNILPYVEQLCKKFIRWEVGTSITWIGIAIAILIIISIFSKVVEDESLGKFIFWISVCIAIGIITKQIFDIVECYTFPERIIYNYLQSYLSNYK